MNTLMISVIVQAQNFYARLRDEERGQTLTEYALIIALIALGVILALIFLGGQIRRLFSEAGSSLVGVPS